MALGKQLRTAFFAVWRRARFGLRGWWFCVAIALFGCLTPSAWSANTGADGNVWRAENNGEWWGAGDSPDAACRSATAGLKARYPWDTREYLYLENKQVNAPGTAGCMGRFSNGVLGIIGTTVRIGQCAAGYLTQPDGSCAPKNPEVKTCAVGHPVFPNTGVKVLTERDDAGSADLPLSRTYRSSVLFGLVTGVGQWLFNWQRELDAPIDTSDTTSAPISAIREDGTSRIFRKRGSTWTTFGSRDTVAGLSDGAGMLTGWQYTVAETGAVETYGTNGKLLSVRERNGRTTTLIYSPSHQLMQVTAPTGRKLTFAYDLQGRIISVAAPDGAITQYAYSANGMLTAVTWPGNVTRQYVYEDARFPTALTGVIDEAGVRYATYAYDDQGRAITSELTGGTDRYQFQYQTNGQTTVTLPSGTTSTYSFLKQNSVLLPTGVSAPCPTCGSTSQSADYDTSGNATRRVGYDGAVTTYAYDALGRQVQRVDAAGTANAITTTTEWHPNWNLPTKAASPGKLETFAYDAVGNLVSYTSAATNDASGAAGLSATPMGDVLRTNWTYDSAGRLVSASESTGSVATGAWAVKYDAQGNVQTVTDPNGRTGNAVKYDAAGRLLEAVNTDGERMKYSYNARGLLLSYAVDGAVVNYDYDANGLLTAIRGPGDYYFGFKYDAAHRLISLLTPVGQTSLVSMANPVQAAKLAALAEIQRTAKLSAVERLWITIKSWFSRLLGFVVGNATANPLLGAIQVVPPIPAQVGGAIGGTSSGNSDLDELLGTGRPMPRPEPLLNEFIKMVRNVTGTNQSTSEDCEDDSRCQSAKQDASSLYWTLNQKRIPQYLSGGTGGHDAGHHKAIIERQNGLRKAIKKVKLYCRPLPAELPEWERVANKEIPILH
ncbi:RHS repeat protein [Ralstonia pseudosolanacearum]|uniref:RHS repeat domain-containing protein n=1 Tax=Ralstonia pseudosolanacearum TaxID=1310165 RepID=UPI001866F406|nr:RHS repeat domain-containing protein [Ralstonia pseudosolanacearum]QOK90899.1 RHS repeat protein [Ralstonia pseudosolanacearum]